MKYRLSGERVRWSLAYRLAAWLDKLELGIVPDDECTERTYRCMCGDGRDCGCAMTNPPSYFGVDGKRHFYDEERR